LFVSGPSAATQPRSSISAQQQHSSSVTVAHSPRCLSFCLVVTPGQHLACSRHRRRRPPRCCIYSLPCSRPIHICVVYMHFRNMHRTRATHIRTHIRTHTHTHSRSHTHLKNVILGHRSDVPTRQSVGSERFVFVFLLKECITRDG
jgi:hypothetical protein